MFRGKKVLCRTPTKDQRTLMASIHNRFDIEVVDAKTGAVKQRAKAENVILNTIWNNYTSSWFSYIAYGGGSGTPTASDTKLFNWKGAAHLSSQTRDLSHAAEGYVSTTKYTALSETTAVGVTITEVGLCTGTSSTSPLCTHAMLTDMNGNPISILKTNTDIINLYATVFFHWDLDGYNGVEFCPDASGWPIGSMGTDYFYFGRGKCGLRTLSSYISATYNASTRTYTITHPRLSVSQMNYGGFQYAMWGPFMVKVPGPHRIVGEIVGTGNGSTIDFATVYDLPSNATVYVDGVVAENVEVSEEPLSINRMGRYMWALSPQATPECLIPRVGTAPCDDVQSGTWNVYGSGIFYNPFHEYGITTWSIAGTLYGSDDLVNWTALTSGRGPYYYKFYDARTPGEYNRYWSNIKTSGLTGKNIHFTNPPPSGSIITIDYDTPMVPKDDNHVYDFSLQVQIGPYVAE